MSLLGSIEKSVLGHINLVGLVEEQGVAAVTAFVAPHVHLDADELKKNAARLRDAAACLENGKLANAVTDTLQFICDAID